MARSASRPEVRRRAARPEGLGRRLARRAAARPLVTGGSTAFVVAFLFVNANALWYQPHVHPGAVLATREPVRFDQPGDRQVDDATTIRIEREADQDPEEVTLPREAPAPRPEPADRADAPTAPLTPAGDPMVRAVQQALYGLKIHLGDVDGLMGPQTRAAIANYRRITGLAPEGEIDAALLAALGLEAGQNTAAVPTPPAMRPEPAPMPAPTQYASAEPASAPDPMIVQVQAGLRAFGNDGIDLDGVPGPRTRAAIREFQSLFGLDVTGDVDEALLTKMSEVGLTN